MSTFALSIATPVGEVFSGMVDHVSIDAPDGRMGFLRGALPRIAVLAAGIIEVTVGERKMQFECADGIFGIVDDKMTVITTYCSDLSENAIKNDITDRLSGRQYSYAKARIASNLLKMNAKKYPEETF